MSIDPAILVMHRTALSPLVETLYELYEWVDEEHAADGERCAACGLVWPCPVENARVMLDDIRASVPPTPEGH